MSIFGVYLATRGIVMIIVPMRDLKNTVKIENMCTTTKAPIFITKNGYGKLVIMDIETFERIIGEAYEAKLVNEGLEDLKAGKTEDGKKVLKDLKEKHSL